jgi:TPR repeat protein
MNLSRWMVCAWGLLTFTAPTFAGYEEAWEAMEKRDYVTALPLLQEAADKNDPRAINALGVFYLQGLGVARDEKRGVVLFEKAANLGSTRAMNALAEVYGKGAVGIPPNVSKARDWAWRSALMNDHTGQFIFFQLASLHELRFLDASGKRDAERYGVLAKRPIQERELDMKAFTMLSRAAEGGFIPAATLVAATLLDSPGETNAIRLSKLLPLLEKEPTLISNPMWAMIKQQNVQLSYLHSLGATYVTPKIYKDALLTVLPMTLLSVSNGLPEGSTCPVERMKLLKMEVTQPLSNKTYLPVDAVFLRSAILVQGDWQERWTYEVCGKTVSVPVDFTADGGGGVVFSVQSKDIQPL